MRALVYRVTKHTIPDQSSSSGASWLLAYTARVRELTQLRVQDIEQRACGPVLLITLDAGPVKTRKARAAPIHPYLVEMGLLDYVEEVKARLGFKSPNASAGKVRSYGTSLLLLA